MRTLIPHYIYIYEYNGAMGCECSVLVVIITISSLEIFSVFEDKNILK
jgi:hypothetical protein